MNLFKANDEQILQAWKNNYVSWGAPHLSLDQYILREQSLSLHPFASRRSTWILQLTNAASPTEFVSSCITFPRKCLICTDTVILERDCISIASVFTPEIHRRKGYAAEMMRKLKELIESDESVAASTLYSEIGKDYYAKLGWDYIDSFIGTLDLQNESVLEFVNESVQDSFNLLFDCDIPEIIKRDVENIKLKLLQTSKPSFAIIPDECISWMFTSADLMRSFLYPDPLTTLPPRGAKISDSYILWNVNWVGRKMVIIRLFIAESNHALDLLRKAAEQACRMNLKKVEIWDPDTNAFKSLMMKEILKICERESDNSLSCVWFKGPENLTWVGNEKYAWV